MNAQPETRTAFIALVGKPNAGKSSLLNRLVGEKVAIVTQKPQTTRTRITGVLTTADPPGVLIHPRGLQTPTAPRGGYLVTP